MENEKISVIMAIYNCAEFLSDAIESILNQTYTNWELILCDDASTDNTYEVAEKYRKNNPEKIVVVRNQENMKLSYSLNKCLKYATGKYIARMDGDDKCLPERFERQIAYLKAHPEYDLVGTAMQRFDDKGLGIINYSIDNPDYYTLRKRLPYHHATILTYKYVYDKLHGYTVSPRTVRGQDYDLWFRFYHEGFNGNNLREPLYLVREDANAVRRRTVRVRVNGIKTTLYGFKLLHYPWWWAIWPVTESIVKCIIPFRAIELYRNLQNRKGNGTPFN